MVYRLSRYTPVVYRALMIHRCIPGSHDPQVYTGLSYQHPVVYRAQLSTPCGIPGSHTSWCIPGSHTSWCILATLPPWVYWATLPPWVYLPSSHYPVYRSSCPSSGPLRGEEALGSSREKPVGREPALLSEPQECDRGCASLRRVLPLFLHETDERSDNHRVTSHVFPMVKHICAGWCTFLAFPG